MKKSLHAPPPLDLILDSETNQLHYEDPTQSHVWPIIEEFQAYLKQKGETIIQNSKFCALFVQGVGFGWLPPNCLKTVLFYGKHILVYT